MVGHICIHVEDFFCDDYFAQLKVMMLEMDCHVVGVKFDICENSCCDMSHENWYWELLRILVIKLKIDYEIRLLGIMISHI